MLVSGMLCPWGSEDLGKYLLGQQARLFLRGNMRLLYLALYRRGRLSRLGLVDRISANLVSHIEHESLQNYQACQKKQEQN